MYLLSPGEQVCISLCNICSPKAQGSQTPFLHFDSYSSD